MECCREHPINASKVCAAPKDFCDDGGVRKST